MIPLKDQPKSYQKIQNIFTYFFLSSQQISITIWENNLSIVKYSGFFFFSFKQIYFNDQNKQKEIHTLFQIVSRTTQKIIPMPSEVKEEKSIEKDKSVEIIKRAAELVINIFTKSKQFILNIQKSSKEICKQANNRNQNLFFFFYIKLNKLKFNIQKNKVMDWINYQKEQLFEVFAKVEDVDEQIFGHTIEILRIKSISNSLGYLSINENQRYFQ
ncbi:unnamed protein product [Paramecium sonneborni]|uniref:Uncharacterized protein n=1 Tax=Paramecium sonneborni TaxID=65129 RepID=A0A8S1RMJ7_9CILI|nr:unnamed protein product [Paramecium sonneborni]